MTTGLEGARRPTLTPDELRELMRPAPWRATSGIIRVYALISTVVAIALWKGGWWLVPAVIIIAALQHALSILQHEAVHGLLYRKRWLNDVVGTWLLSYPIGFTMGYRATHFAHHRHLGEDTVDPDAPNYAPFPSSRRVFLWSIFRAFSGIGAMTQFFRGGTGSVPSLSVSIRIQALAGIVITNVVIAGIFVLAGHPFLYIGLWLLPLVTFTKGFTYLRNMAEHLMRTDAPAGAARLRTFRSSLLERFFLAPLHFHIHAEHHWYPQVPYSRLPALRRVLRTREGYGQYAEQAGSYISVLRRAIRGQPMV